MIGVELCYHRDVSAPAQTLTARAAARCREQGVLVLTAGPFGNVLRLLCPLVIEDADLTRGLDVMEESIVIAAKEHAS
jgi:4-aminobutyrate aminotransferase/(S)-3-amino-2-methylpropionate transaminase